MFDQSFCSKTMNSARICGHGQQQNQMYHLAFLSSASDSLKCLEEQCVTLLCPSQVTCMNVLHFSLHKKKKKERTKLSAKQWCTAGVIQTQIFFTIFIIILHAGTQCSLANSQMIQNWEEWFVHRMVVLLLRGTLASWRNSSVNGNEKSCTWGGITSISAHGDD